MEKEEEYRKLLEICPPHDTKEFIEFVKKYNPVVTENQYWVVIENFKHHSATTPFYTVFPVHYTEEWGDLSEAEMVALRDIFAKYPDWYKFQNVQEVRSVKRIHLHMLRDHTEYIKLLSKLVYGEEIIELFEELKIRRPNLYQGIIAGLQRDREKDAI